MMRRGGGGGGRKIVVDTNAPLEAFRRFLVYSVKAVPGEYAGQNEVFPYTVKAGSLIAVDAEGDCRRVVDACGHPVSAGAGVGLMRVPECRVRSIEYRSASGRTALKWRRDPQTARGRIGRVNGVATEWSADNLGAAGVLTPKWAAGQAAVLKAKSARAAAGWPAAPDLRTGGGNRLERRRRQHGRIMSGDVLTFPTGRESGRAGGEIGRGQAIPQAAAAAAGATGAGRARRPESGSAA